MTVREEYRAGLRRTGSHWGDSVGIEGWDGWTIEDHSGGLCVCSPGTCAKELGYPDDSELELAEVVLHALHEEVTR